MVSVIVLLLKRKIVLETSVTIDTKLRIAPEIIPLAIWGIVMTINVFNLPAPRLMAASSVDMGICIMVAVAERLV